MSAPRARIQAPRSCATSPDLDAASKAAARYIRAHGPDGGHCLTLAQTRAPEWLAIKARLDAALWPDRPVPVPPQQPVQLSLFTVAS